MILQDTIEILALRG